MARGWFGDSKGHREAALSSRSRGKRTKIRNLEMKAERKKSKKKTFSGMMKTQKQTLLKPIVEKKIKWGFDLTGFGSAEKFQAVLDRHGLSKYKRVTHTIDHDSEKYYTYTWSGNDLIIITNNNPLTGEYTKPKYRKNQKGYASYIGVEGTESKVKALVKTIRDNAEFIKDESPYGRDFV